ncbi:MAG: cardiolipin synthase B [Chthoniobacterales bacterium]|nr:MAG: cardiolipin synthase B [Chthoniobacterales bacterium]
MMKLRAGIRCARLAMMAATLLGGCTIHEQKTVKQELAPVYSAASPSFRQAAGSLLGGSFVAGNNIVTLVNGREIFPPMLAAIHSAQRTINFETYVFWDGEIGRKFTEALAERARAGVKVNAILDAQGTAKLGLENLELLRSAGVQVVKYHSIFWLDPRRFNNRTHRKLLIVDGKVGFIGGVGIADEWLGNAEAPKYWRDNHYKVTGPVVAQLQGAFMDNWLKARGEVLHGPEYFPPLSATGPYAAQVSRSSPSRGGSSLRLLYLLAIASAQHSLLIENAYFIPDDLVRQELIHAAQRGARVEILVPGEHIDQKAVRWASRRHYAELLKSGIKIFEFEPTMVHVKLMIVDGAFVSVGSGNFDLRSLRLNDEANMNVLDRSFAEQQTKLFAIDKRRSREITLTETGGLNLLNPIGQVSDGLAPEL